MSFVDVFVDHQRTCGVKSIASDRRITLLSVTMRVVRYIR